MISGWRSGYRPRLRRGIVVAPADADRWQVRWDFDQVTFLEGQACGQVLPWLVPTLDGSRTLADLEKLAHERSSLTEMRAVLECLEQHSFLAVDDDQSDLAGQEVAVALATADIDAVAISERMRKQRPVVCGNSSTAECLTRSLVGTGFVRTSLVSSAEKLSELLSSTSRNSEPDSDDLIQEMPIVVEPDWLPQDLDRINAGLLDQRRPWMLLGAWNRRVLVGPIFLPGETACYACHRRRLASHRREWEAFEALDRWRRTQASPLTPAPILTAVAELAAAWTALEVLRYTTGIGSPRTLGRVLVYDPEEIRLVVEPVLRVPWCSICSEITAAGTRG